MDSLEQKLWDLAGEIALEEHVMGCHVKDGKLLYNLGEEACQRSCENVIRIQSELRDFVNTLGEKK